MNNKNVKENFNEGFKITTDEAIKLIDMLKERVTQTSLDFPKLGNKIEFEVQAKKEGERFVISIRRGTIDKNKCTYQGRTYKNSIPLLRLDVTNSFHINPDGQKIEGTHLHIYSQENEMREAIPFDIKNANLYDYCLGFFKKFNLVEDSCGILYQMEL